MEPSTLVQSHITEGLKEAREGQSLSAESHIRNTDCEHILQCGVFVRSQIKHFITRGIMTLSNSDKSVENIF